MKGSEPCNSKCPYWPDGCLVICEQNLSPRNQFKAAEINEIKHDKSVIEAVQKREPITVLGVKYYADGFSQTSLPDRMDEAADTCVEATERYYTGEFKAKNPENVAWRPVNLRAVAENWRREDAEKTLKSALAQVIHDNWGGAPSPSSNHVADAILAQYDVTPKSTATQRSG
jgi:hypothetical protein